MPVPEHDRGKQMRIEQFTTTVTKQTEGTSSSVVLRALPLGRCADPVMPPSAVGVLSKLIWWLLNPATH